MKQENRELLQKWIKELNICTDKKSINQEDVTLDSLIIVLDRALSNLTKLFEKLRADLQHIVNDENQQTQPQGPAEHESWEQLCEQKQKQGFEMDLNLKSGTLKDQNLNHHIFVTPGDKDLSEAKKVDNDGEGEIQ